jgi:hypothetical protein
MWVSYPVAGVRYLEEDLLSFHADLARDLITVLSIEGE